MQTDQELTSFTNHRIKQKRVYLTIIMRQIREVIIYPKFTTSSRRSRTLNTRIGTCIRNRKDTKPLLTTQITDNTKYSVNDRNHPMNLSVSSLNSLSKSRDSRMGASMTQNNDPRNESSLRKRKIRSKLTIFKVNKQGLKLAKEYTGSENFAETKKKRIKKSFSPMGNEIYLKKPTRQGRDFINYWSAKTSKRATKRKSRRSNTKEYFYRIRGDPDGFN
ncbi:unnamed protein product [Moneuplotes crassus]|uniref:Uncharacterized protein n=1 Tax=Euplotes crassus TaxID=5936 RepID=A0AAD1U8T9_EUPCR|nr:unnamed protein product [Moneuplotes crassus]